MNAECNNTLGSYKCSCKDGFHRNGTNCTGNLLKHFKHRLSPALYKGAFKKKSHLHDNPFRVLGVDECADRIHNCNVNADCNNTLGSYKCSCKDGFHGNGTNCTGN